MIKITLKIPNHMEINRITHLSISSQMVSSLALSRFRLCVSNSITLTGHLAIFGSKLEPDIFKWKPFTFVNMWQGFPSPNCQSLNCHWAPWANTATTRSLQKNKYLSLFWQPTQPNLLNQPVVRLHLINIVNNFELNSLAILTSVHDQFGLFKQVLVVHFLFLLVGCDELELLKDVENVGHLNERGACCWNDYDRVLVRPLLKLCAAFTGWLRFVDAVRTAKDRDWIGLLLGGYQLTWLERFELRWLCNVVWTFAKLEVKISMIRSQKLWFFDLESFKKNSIYICKDW